MIYKRSFWGITTIENIFNQVLITQWKTVLYDTD